MVLPPLSLCCIGCCCWRCWNDGISGGGGSSSYALPPRSGTYQQHRHISHSTPWIYTMHSTVLHCNGTVAKLISYQRQHPLLNMFYTVCKNTKIPIFKPQNRRLPSITWHTSPEFRLLRSRRTMHTEWQTRQTAIGCYFSIDCYQSLFGQTLYKTRDETNNEHQYLLSCLTWA